MRLYDLTTPEHRLIATKKFETPIARRAGSRTSRDLAEEAPARRFVPC